jgi:N utilization substance protein B
MKKATDPRHLRRRKTVKSLFGWSFKEQEVENSLAKKVIKRAKMIDKIIQKNAPLWPIEQINRLDLAILRLAIFELAIEKKEPKKVIIDEAVELAKEFGGESSPAFINGVLGAVLVSNNKNGNKS